eukprot:m.252073 g.252073  ORF g.252073 m.252073 type:complete len:60 (+) comp15906_c0_seq2:1465-1644(+)
MDIRQSLKAGESVIIRPFESTMKAIDAVIMTCDEEGQVWCTLMQVTINKEHRQHLRLTV